MDEKLKNIEHVQKTEFPKDSESEFRDLVDMGAYQSLANNELFQGLHAEEQCDVMYNTLQNCLQTRESRFYRLVQGKPDLAAQYRDQEIKPLRVAMQALDEIALAQGTSQSLQEEISVLEDTLDH